MRFSENPVLRSLLVHTFLAFSIFYHLSHDGAQVRGSAGLAGKTQTHFNMTLSEPRKSVAEKMPVLPIREGLPTEVKNPNPREVESTEPLQKKEMKSAGVSDSAPSGTQGQGGSSDTPSDEIGNSDRSNAEGVYLLKLQQKIQENLETVGYIEFDRKTMVRFLIHKNGAIEKIEVIHSSGDPALDRKAARAVQKVQTFLERPADLQVQVPVLFRATR